MPGCVKGVACGIEGDDRDFSTGKRTGRAYFREVSTRIGPAADLAFDLDPLAGSGLYLCGNTNDCTQFTAVMEAIRVPRLGPGRPRVRRDHVEYAHLGTRVDPAPQRGRLRDHRRVRPRTPGDEAAVGEGGPHPGEGVTVRTGGKTVNTWQTIAGGDVPKDSTNADGEKNSFTYDTAGNTTSVAQTGTGGGNVSYDYNPATPTCGGLEGQRLHGQEAADRQVQHERPLSVRRDRQRDGRRLHRRLRQYRRELHRPLPAEVDHRGRQGVRRSVRFHRPERTHPPG